MDFTNNPRNIPPRRPTPGTPPRSMPQRRVFSDFAVRPNAPINGAPVRPAAPTPVPVHPATPPRPTPIPVTTAVPPARPQPPMPRPAMPPTPPAHTPPTALQAPAPPPAPTPQHPHHPPHHTGKDAKAPRAHNTTGHAGLIGFIFFVVFAGLLLSPFIPGKILDNFPGSSQSSSSGDQTIGCIHETTNNSTSLSYNLKVGSPIVYDYSTTTTQKATCDGKQQTATGGRSSQFNPLGLAADIAIALVLAVVLARVWRKLFGAKD